MLVPASVVIVLLLPVVFGNEITQPKTALNHGTVEATIKTEIVSGGNIKNDKDDSTHETNPTDKKDKTDDKGNQVNKDVGDTKNYDDYFDLISSEEDDEYAECNDDDDEVENDYEKDKENHNIEQETVNKKLSISSTRISFDDDTCRELWIKAKSFYIPCKSWRTLCKMKEGGCHLTEPLGDQPEVDQTIFFEYEFHVIKSRPSKSLDERCADLKNKRKKVPTAPASKTQTVDEESDKHTLHGGEDSVHISPKGNIEAKLVDEDKDNIDDDDIDEDGECDSCDDEGDEYDDKVMGAYKTSGNEQGKPNQDSAVVQLDEKTCRDLWTKAKAFRRPCNSWSTLCQMKDGGCDLAEPLGTIRSNAEISHTIFFEHLQFHLIKSKSRKGLDERCVKLKSLEAHSKVKLDEEACKQLWVKAKAFSRPCKSWSTLCKMKRGGCEITEPLGTIENHPEISHTIFYEYEFHLIKSRSSKGLEQRCVDDS